MKFSLIATLALVSAAMAAPTSSVVPNNLGGTNATASITVSNPNNATSASTKLNAGVMAIALTSVATSVYALI